MVIGIVSYKIFSHPKYKKFIASPWRVCKLEILGQDDQKRKNVSQLLLTYHDWTVKFFNLYIKNKLNFQVEYIKYHQKQVNNRVSYSCILKNSKGQFAYMRHYDLAKGASKPRKWDLCLATVCKTVAKHNFSPNKQYDVKYRAILVSPRYVDSSMLIININEQTPDHPIYQNTGIVSETYMKECLKRYFINFETIY